MSLDPLANLAGILRTEGGLLADVTRDADDGHAGGFGATVAAGQRAAGREADYALLVEAIREGYLLHYDDAGRVVRTSDPDLALLAGDRLYALGLERLAALGDLDAVQILADLISQGAQVNAEGRPQDAEQVWARAAASLSDGRPPHN